MKYEYGVEYKTNGKKPDLPDDIDIDIDSAPMEPWWSYIGAKFRIVDERYRPVSELVKQGQEICGKIEEKLSSVDDALNWYDYDKQQATALPPVWVECEVLNSVFGDGAEWEKCKINWIGDFVCVYTSSSCNERCAALEHVKFRQLDWNRKADEEKRKFIENGVKAVGDYFNLGDALHRLYDAGCRFTENKAAS